MEDGGGTGPHIQRRWNDESPSAATSRLASRGRDQGQMSIITAVSLVNNLLQNGLVSVVAICRK